MFDGMWRGACAVGGARRICWDRVNASNLNTEHARSGSDIGGGAIVN